MLRSTVRVSLSQYMSRYHSACKFLLLLFIAAEVCKGQSSPFTPELLQTLRQVQGTASTSQAGYKFLEHLSDEIGPRLPGSPQAAAAVEYMTSQLQRLGLEVSHEPVTVPHWIRGEERAELVSFAGMVPGVRQKIVITALGGLRASP